MTAPEMRPKRVAVVLVAVYVVFWVQFGAVRPENFGGIDEWMILSLVSGGIAAVPHANRPFGLLFNLPVGLFPAHLLEGSWLVHGHYLVLAGLLTSLLLLRLAPGRPEWALLAGVFAATWAPSDWLRLNSIYSSAYAGVTATTVLSLWLLATSGGRPVLVVFAAALGFLATRVHEGPLPVLLIAPLLLGAFGVRLSRAGLALYYTVMALALAAVVVPLAHGRPETIYQREVLGVYLDVAGLAARLAEQFRLHLGPLFWAGRGMLGLRAIVSALMVVLAALLLGRTGTEPRAALLLVRGAIVGILGAAASYSAFLVGARMTASAGRTQIVAGPWIAMAVAATILLLARAFPGRARLPVVAALGAFVAANAAARTSQLQESWDRTGGAYSRQAHAMQQVLAIAPDLKPGSLLIFVDGGRTWLGTFVFHHAVDLLYERKAGGCVANSREDLFITCFMDPAGVHQEPWPMLRAPWGVLPRTYRFDEVMVLSSDSAGRVKLEEEWPKELPALPPGAAYAPRSRATPLATRPRARSVLDRLAPPPAPPS